MFYEYVSHASFVVASAVGGIIALIYAYTAVTKRKRAR